MVKNDRFKNCILLIITISLFTYFVSGFAPEPEITPSTVIVR